MEAPEKIYIQPRTIEQLKHQNIVYTKPLADNSIEYIRKDALIEKACEWLRTHSEDDYFELIPDANYCGAGNLNKKRMIEDFKEYLKK